MIEQKLQHIQGMRQEQVMSPQQIMSLEFLLAPMLQLQEKINTELIENPVLEQDSTALDDLVGDPLAGPISSDNNSDAAASEVEKDESLADIIQLYDHWRDYAPATAPSQYNNADEDERRQYFMESIVASSSLQDILLEQLRTSDIDTRLTLIAETIIGSINEKGYLSTHPADIAIICNADLKDVKKAITYIQTFDPPGICASSVKECLQLQLQRKKQKKTLEYKLVTEHLDLLAKNHIPDIARKMKITTSQVYELVEHLKTLKPFPTIGISLQNSSAEYVSPEITLKKDGDDFEIIPNNKSFPVLKISAYYMKLIESPDTSADVKQYIKEKILRGNMLIKSLDQRKSTLHRITEVILDKQKEFFEKGKEFLKPLTMVQVAEKVNVHETTISRAIHGKFIDTPQGFFPFKFFFSTGFENNDGEMIASKSIKEKIKTIIDNEPNNKPYSDLKMVAELKNRGYKVARRTVAKYREEMGILPSNLRKTFYR